MNHQTNGATDHRIGWKPLLYNNNMRGPLNDEICFKISRFKLTQCCHSFRLVPVKFKTNTYKITGFDVYISKISYGFRSYLIWPLFVLFKPSFVVK